MMAFEYGIKQSKTSEAVRIVPRVGSEFSQSTLTIMSERLASRGLRVELRRSDMYVSATPPCASESLIDEIYACLPRNVSERQAKRLAREKTRTVGYNALTDQYMELSEESATSFIDSELGNITSYDARAISSFIRGNTPIFSDSVSAATIRAMHQGGFVEKTMIGGRCVKHPSFAKFKSRYRKTLQSVSLLVATMKN